MFGKKRERDALVIPHPYFLAWGAEGTD